MPGLDAPFGPPLTGEVTTLTGNSSLLLICICGYNVARCKAADQIRGQAIGIDGGWTAQ